MDVRKSGSQPSGKAPAEHFTGTVRIDPLFHAPDPARVLKVSDEEYACQDVGGNRS